MTPTLLLRPVLACLAAVTLASCGGVDSDPHRFENMALAIAAIPLDGTPARAAPSRTAEQAGLRPALQPVRVEVMDPHALWDARDAGLRGAVGQAAPRMIEAAAPVVVHAVTQEISSRAAAVTRAVDRRPGLRSALPVKPAHGRALVQLGAFSTEAAARAAWSRLKGGEASRALAGLSPVFEPVRIGDRQLVRLKVPAPASGAAAICAAAGIDDPWCRRA
jgi:hypothetical protein